MWSATDGRKQNNGEKKTLAVINVFPHKIGFRQMDDSGGGGDGGGGSLQNNIVVLCDIGQNETGE